MNKPRINFNKSVKMHLCCATDTLQPAMKHIYFKDGFAIATDAQILVKNKLSECSTLDESTFDLLNGKMISAAAYKAILSYDIAIITEDGFLCKNNHDYYNEVLYKFSNNATMYPNFDSVIPTSDAKAELSKIRFNIKLLNILMQSLQDGNEYYMQFTGENRAILFKHHYHQSVGIIMPKLFEE